jgi:PAS domain S-box-containing protein
VAAAGEADTAAGSSDAAVEPPDVPATELLEPDAKQDAPPAPDADMVTDEVNETAADEEFAAAPAASDHDAGTAPAFAAADSAETGEPAPSGAADGDGEDEAAEGAQGLAPREASILSRLPVPILIHAGDVLHYANDEFLALTGHASLRSLDEAGGLGSLFADRYEDDAGDGGDRALRLRTADGHEFPIDALLRSVPWNGGHALMLVVRRAGDAPDAGAPPARDDRAEMKAHIAELRTIIDTATDGVIVIGTNGLIRSVSRPAEALFGYDSDDIAGKPFVSLFAMESQRAARDYLTGLSDHGVASVLNDGREVIGREAQGRFIPLFLSIGRLPGDSGFCAVVRDITPWKRAEEELTKSRALAERASSQKSDFLARISHEIRTPLNAIIGFSELMVDERFGPIGSDRYRDYLRDINRSGNHVLDLVNDLLDISKIEAGEQDMTYEAVSLNDTLAQTVAMMQPQANRERVIIRSSFASRLPDVVADLRSVRQIALNLLSNAVRYTQAGGQVIVSTAYEPSGDVVMRVRDTGIGMSTAEIEQAMKPFKQINALKGIRSEGTGLGLPLTKAMVEANRARFSINSTPGEGTLVEVTFPSTRVLAE